MLRDSQCHWKQWIITEYRTAKVYDQNLLRGSKAIADKLDYGEIMLDVNDDDLKELDTIISSNIFEVPDIKRIVYKNRRGKHKGVILWCKSNLGCCQVIPLFVTDQKYNLVKIDDIEIKVEKKSAF